MLMNKRNVRLLMLGAFVLVIAGCTSIEPSKVRPDGFAQAHWVEDYVTGLSFPWAMTWLPDGSLLLTERLGKIKLIRDGKVVADIVGVPEVMAASPYDGLLDVEIDPDFETSPYVYLTYTRGTATERVGVVYRARLEGNRLVDGQELFSTSPPAPTGGPNITRIQFLPDKSLIVGIGSSGQPGSGMVQRVDGDIGKIIRLYRDGTIPDDNALAAADPNAKPELWAIGLRSPVGFALDDDDRLWGLDIGPQGGDELNLLEAGGNFGWPLLSWGFDYSGRAMSDKQSAPGFVDPVVVWSPSIAPSGLTYYRGDAFPGWQGDLFLGALADQAILRLRIRDNKVVQQQLLLSNLNERIRSVEAGPDGLLYAITDSSKAKILRIRPGQPAGADLARVAQPFDMPAGSTIIERLKQHGVMQSEETAAAEALGYDPVRAQFLFAQNCATCHSMEEGAESAIGPSLHGVAGRRSGTLPGYSYSAAMANSATSVVWDYFTLTAFLTSPQAYYPGTKMAAAPLSYADALQVGIYLNGGKTF
jgi:glucose/arabinose dehydrogenase/cytochrome c2